MTRRLPRGHRLGKYKLVQKLAEGGFGTVYRAHDTVEGVHVALKVPRADLVTAKALEWFRHEVRLHASLDHPNILVLKSADMIDGQLVVAYPLGIESLGDRMRRRMGIETFLALAEQMLAAVAHAHQRSVIHCDVKPENFILFPEGRIRLTDFSISKMALRTVIGSGSGTLGYVAPEQAMGKTSFRSDVFSLGLIFYQMLSGELFEWPFRWPGPEDAKVRRKVPPTFIAWLRRSLDIEPARRFRDAAEMLTTFQRLRPHVRRHQATQVRKRHGGNTRRDWTEVRFRQFRQQYGAELELKHRCHKCDGPTSEAMAACPWCGVKAKFTGPTRFPARCPRCQRGRKADWRFCAWCYGAGFTDVSERSYEDQRYDGRCANDACRGPLMPFMRYCPWCRRKNAKPTRITGVSDRCPGCKQGVVRSFWDHCPWCARRLK